MKRPPPGGPELFPEPPSPARRPAEGTRSSGAGDAAPLADRMRPRRLEEVVGQTALVGPSGVLRRAIERGELHSFVLWGPPGSGKTTLARLYAASASARYVEYSAVLSGVKEIRDAVAAAAEALRGGRRTVLFVDEIHRFNRAQQDAFLPHVENGTILLVGATTENPSFALNASLLSRLRVYTLAPLAPGDLVRLLGSALADRERGLGGSGLAADEEVLLTIAATAEGDARVALTLLDLASRGKAGSPPGTRLTREDVAAAAGAKHLLYDRSGEEHFNLISALHKSLRSSDPDAALYWLERMLVSGEDPRFLARRLVRFASEDVGNADPQALGVALAAWEAFERLGPPEGELALAQAALYLALAPRSAGVYDASRRARERIAEGPNPPVPLHIRNAPTGLMKNLGYGSGYAYAHTDPEAALRQSNLPEALAGSIFYDPKPIGFEKTLRERLEVIRKMRNSKNPPESDGPNPPASSGR